jgi:hypothetical protein
MKRALLVLLVLGLLALSTAVFAAGGYGSQYAKQAYQGVRVQAGWAKPTDVNSALVWGASYIWKNALLSVNYFDADADNISPSVSVKSLSVEGSYLWRAQVDPSLYYGLGWGLAFTDAGKNTTSGMWNLVLGKEFNSGKNFGKPGLFVEGRWNLGGRFSIPATGDPSLDGPRIQLGWKF